MVRTGSVDRDTSPTIILPKGKTKRAIFNDDYLVWKLLDPGSTIIVTENSFMTHNAWYESAKNIICGYNQNPIIKDIPQWEIIDFLDVFGYHDFESRAI